MHLAGGVSKEISPYDCILNTLYRAVFNGKNVYKKYSPAFVSFPQNFPGAFCAGVKVKSCEIEKKIKVKNVSIQDKNMVTLESSLKYSFPFNILFRDITSIYCFFFVKNKPNCGCFH